jgi:nicotinamide mononucleotide adenylyltransferase
MKSFFQFLSESTAVQQAARLGLKSDGHGGWYDNKGEFVAKTEKGRLKFYNKRQRIGQQDPAQTDKEKNLSATSYEKEPAQEPAAQQQAPAPEQPASQQAPAQEGPPPVEKTKGTLTIAFGRFNPPHIGHQKLMDMAASGSEDGDYIVVPSRTQDKKKNPLDADTKISYLRKMFPQHSEKIVNDAQNRTIFDVLKKAHMDGYTNVKIYGGNDRVSDFQKLSGDYNGKLYQFDNIEVIDAGKRDTKSKKKVERAEASSQRRFAAEGDFESFKSFLPKELDDKDAKELYNQVRAAMNIKEGWNLWEIAPKLDFIQLRENYINGNIFNIGQLVENLNTGLVGKIIRRGTNYLICVTEDNIMFKSWIKDVMEAVTNSNAPSGVPADQRLVGTDAHRKYVEKLVPGSEWGKQFINKYRKK